MNKKILALIIAFAACTVDDQGETKYTQCIGDAHEIRVTNATDVMNVYSTGYMSFEGEECYIDQLISERVEGKSFTTFITSCSCEFDIDGEPGLAPKWYLNIDVECKSGKVLGFMVPNWWNYPWLEMQNPCGSL